MLASACLFSRERERESLITLYLSLRVSKEIERERTLAPASESKLYLSSLAWKSSTVKGTPFKGAVRHIKYVFLFCSHFSRLHLSHSLSTLPPSSDSNKKLVSMAAKSDTHLCCLDASNPLLDPCSSSRLGHAIKMVANAQVSFMRVFVERVGVAAVDFSCSPEKLYSVLESDEIGGFVGPSEFSDDGHSEMSSFRKIGDESSFVVRAVLKKIKRRALMGDKSKL